MAPPDIIYIGGDRIVDHVSKFEGDARGLEWHPVSNPLPPSDDAPPDFMTLISVVSRLYRRRRYLEFSEVDFNMHDVGVVRIGTGAFVRYLGWTDYSVPSSEQQGVYEKSMGCITPKVLQRFFASDGFVVPSVVGLLKGFLSECQVLSQPPSPLASKYYPSCWHWLAYRSVHSSADGPAMSRHGGSIHDARGLCIGRL